MILQNQHSRKGFLVCLTGLLLSAAGGYGQSSISVLPENNKPALSSEQRRQGHFAQSEQSANEFLATSPKNTALGNNSDEEKAIYNIAIGKLRTNSPDAEDYAKSTINTTSNPVYSQRIAYGLANSYFRKDRYTDAIKYYEEAGIDNLSNDEIGDQKFELAYCYFNSKQFNKARPLFLAIKDVKDSKYYIAANYYYGLLSYNENKYNTALHSFEIVKDEKAYSKIVPYYIAEIYYFTGNRAKALSLAQELLARPEKSFYYKELHLLAAQCLFEEQEYAKARPLFDYYYKHSKKIRKEELYEIAYCDYKMSEWESAIEKFKMLSDTRDSLGQTSMYLLGDCYLKTGSKQSARNAFGICADMSFNKGQQEAAMMLFARLSYESGNNGDALRSLKSLLHTYPKTKYHDEANTLTSDLLIKTNKYEEALDLLRDVRTKDLEYKTVYQKATYGFAVQKFRKGELKKADEYFAYSLLYPISAEYEKATYFWRGEIAYNQGKYGDAISLSQNFISRKGDLATVEKISPQATLQHACLNMGYSAMELGNYVAAQDYFGQAKEARAGDRSSKQVASVLEADAVFLQKNYPKAIGLYDKIIDAGGTDVPYATYQKSILLGLEGKNTEKIALLKTLTNEIPASVYSSTALYEIALTYIEMDNYPEALKALDQIIESGSDKSLLPKAWVKTGFLHQQLGDDILAIAAYRRVVVDYPGAEERYAALEALKSLYIQTNQPGQYTRLLSESNLPSADSSSLDSTYYAAAETQFAANKWEKARQGFTDYLRHFPNGIFSVKAHYYLGESAFRLKKYSEAGSQYDVVLSNPWNDFSENSAKRGATIAMELKNYDNAYSHYTSLLNHLSDYNSVEMIYTGLMKSGFQAGKYAEAGKYADTLLTISSLPLETTNEARFIKARTLQLSSQLNEAKTAYEVLTGNKNGELAAESRYHISEILLQQDSLKAAEKAANKTIELSAGFDYWVVKSYVLLADILTRQKDYFNAKALLQSIVKNTKIEEVKKEAAEKLEAVKKAEKSNSKLSEE